MEMITESKQCMNEVENMVICKELKIIYVSIPFLETYMIEKGGDKNNNNIMTYYLKHRESKLQYQKEYNARNKDTYLEYQKSYYETKREDILNKKKEKVICECGRSVSFGQLTTHKKTKLHLKHLNKNNNDNDYA
jgi:hypothetical protein